MCIQLAHAGRKASSHKPWDGGQLIPPNEGGWLPVAPSALPHAAHEAPPLALDAVRYFNILSTFALLGYLAHYFFGAVVRAERHLHRPPGVRDGLPRAGDRDRRRVRPGRRRAPQVPVALRDRLLALHLLRAVHRGLPDAGAHYDQREHRCNLIYLT